MAGVFVVHKKFVINKFIMGLIKIRPCNITTPINRNYYVTRTNVSWYHLALSFVLTLHFLVFEGVYTVLKQKKYKVLTKNLNSRYNGRPGRFYFPKGSFCSSFGDSRNQTLILLHYHKKTRCKVFKLVF